MIQDVNIAFSDPSQKPFHGSVPATVTIVNEPLGPGTQMASVTGPLGGGGSLGGLGGSS
jgi:hypothetical protein